MSYHLHFDNQTGSSITFCLFQENGILDENSYSVIWFKGEVHAWEKVGPIILPSKVSISVQSHDPAHKVLGPVDVERGDTWSYDSEKQDLSKVGSDENDPTVEVVNKNKAAVDLSVWKGNDKVFTQKNIEESVSLAVSSKVFVLASEDLIPFRKGDEVQVLAQNLDPTAYELEGSDTTIVARYSDGVLKLQ